MTLRRNISDTENVLSFIRIVEKMHTVSDLHARSTEIQMKNIRKNRSDPSIQGAVHEILCDRVPLPAIADVKD